MTTPFAALEARLYDRSLAMLANATATIAAGVVEGVFDPEAIDGLNMNSVRPTFLGSLAALGAVSNGDSITITSAAHGLSAAAYTVAETSTEAGQIRLWLRKAA